MYSDHDHLINQTGLPHSDISGSKLVWQLPEAFRSLLRPSSLIRVKASTIYVSNLLLQCILLFIVRRSSPFEGKIPADNRFAANRSRHNIRNFFATNSCIF